MNKAKEVTGVVLPMNQEPALPLNLREEALYDLATQGSAIPECDEIFGGSIDAV